MNDDNVFQFGAVPGGKGDDEDKSIPINDYVVIDVDGNEFYATGFMIFTPHHCAIMRDSGKGAIPLLVVPLNRVAAAEVYEETDEESSLI